MLETRNLQGATRHLIGPEPTSAGRNRTRGSARAHLNWDARFRVIGHMTAQEPTSVGRKGSEP
jgi:hypothetical protein